MALVLSLRILAYLEPEDFSYAFYFFTVPCVERLAFLHWIIFAKLSRTYL